MSERPRRFQKYLTDRNISLVFRWWAAGAVYFFIGWGTSLGNQQFLIDFVNIGSKRPPRENTGWQRTSDYLVELLKNIFIVLIVALIYLAINRTAIFLFELSPEAVFLPGEPILFGLFYLIVWVILDAIAKKIKTGRLS